MTQNESIWSSRSFYDNKSTEINHDDIIKDMKSKYWKDLDDYLATNRYTPESAEVRKDIMVMSQAAHDYEKLISYLSTCLENECKNKIRDDRVQLSLLKTELENLISAPDYEVISWSEKSWAINIKNFDIEKWQKDSGRITTENTSMPWWKKITYGNNQSLYIEYKWWDKVSFFRELNWGYLWAWDIDYKQSVITKWKYNRNWSFETQRIEKNANIIFKIKSLQLNLNMKFYDYWEKIDK